VRVDDVAGSRPGRYCPSRYRMSFNSRNEKMRVNDVAGNIFKAQAAGGRHARDARVVLPEPWWGGAGCQYQNPSCNHAWFQRLKLKCAGPLSNFALKFNLRRYTWTLTRTARYRWRSLRRTLGARTRLQSSSARHGGAG